VQPIAILVEDKADIDKFADFEADAAPAPAPAKEEPKEEPSSPPPPPPKESAPAPPPKKEAPKAAPPSKGDKGRVLASPAARKLAAEKGVSGRG
jgi:pyruvate/2-oxoglutarate dehydrogenase complex dihydrolipoamide acyltransferase (E2) component